VFGFDTGFVAYARGWDSLRAEDCGLLWEHLILDALVAAGLPRFHFWRDKQQREVDFVVSPLHGSGYARTMSGFKVEFVSPAELRASFMEP